MTTASLGGGSYMEVEVNSIIAEKQVDARN
jgi:hypothetical protein